VTGPHRRPALWIGEAPAPGPPVPTSSCARSRPGAAGRLHPGLRWIRPVAGFSAATADLNEQNKNLPVIRRCAESGPLFRRSDISL